jgi:hypothetical protein
MPGGEVGGDQLNEIKRKSKESEGKKKKKGKANMT